MRVRVEYWNQCRGFRRHNSAKGVGGDVSDQSLAQILANALVAQIEEGLVFDDGSADTAAKLIQAKGRLGVGRIQVVEWVARVKDVVAHVIKGAPVIKVRAGDGGHSQLSAGGGAAVFGGVQHRLDAELLNGIGGNGQPNVGLLHLVDDVGVVHAIQGDGVVV